MLETDKTVELFLFWVVSLRSASQMLPQTSSDVHIRCSTFGEWKFCWFFSFFFLVRAIARIVVCCWFWFVCLFFFLFLNLCVFYLFITETDGLIREARGWVEDPLIVSVNWKLCRAGQLDLLFPCLFRFQCESLHGCMLVGEHRAAVLGQRRQRGEWQPQLKDFGYLELLVRV